MFLPGALIGLSRNDYEPDLCFWANEVACQFVADQTVFPVPHLIIEILSPSSAHRDRGVKCEDYAAHGVTEYWIVDTDARTIEQYFLADGQFTLAGKFDDGEVTSRAIVGFTMPVNAAFDDAANLAALRRVLQQ